MAEPEIIELAKKLKVEGSTICNKEAYAGVVAKGLSPEEEAMRKKHFDFCMFGFKKGVESVKK